MSVNWQDVLLALKISGVGIVVLLLVLAALAGIISLLTRFIKDAPEEEESTSEEEEKTPSPAPATGTDLSKIAAIAVAIARAQSEYSAAGESSVSLKNSWGQFHLNRRLNLSSTFRRSK